MNLPLGPNEPAPDITDRTKAERLARAQSLVMQGTRDAVIILDPQGRILDMNPAAEAAMGWSREEGVGRKDTELYELLKVSGVSIDEIAKSLKENGNWHGQFSYTRPDGTLVHVETTSFAIPEPGSSKAGRISVIRDISKHKATQDELRKNRDRLLDANRIGRVGHWEIDAVNWRVRMYGEMYLELGAKFEETEASHQESFASLHEDDVERVRIAYERALGEGVRFDEIYRIYHPDDRIFHVRAVGEAFRDADNKIIGMRGTIHDVSEQKEAEEAIRASEQSVSAILQNVADSVITIDEAGAILSANQAFARTFGYSQNELIGKDVTVVMPESHRAGHAAYLNRYLETGESRILGKAPRELQAVAKDGRVFPIELMIGEAMVGGRRVFIGSVRDISDRKQAEQELGTAQERLSAAQRIAGLGSFELNLATGETVWSEELFRIFDLDPEHDEPLRSDRYFEQVHPDDRDNLKAFIESALDPESEDESLDFENRITTKLGNEKIVLGFRKAQFDGQGNPVMLTGTIQNVTALRQAEEKLQQAQKMEAIGQLTGGIAHDFNNLLAVISGNLELVTEQLPGDSDLRDMLQAALGASQRGADLTGRLLSFSRRQTLVPQPTDINQLSGHMLDLARRTLGESVEVVFEPAKEAWWASVDPAQLENALLNLAINARDAMPGGGTLTIRTSNIGTQAKSFTPPEALPTGEYVLIEVADTGVGMSEEVRGKVFEPFFTTKEVGEGSGLGLSMVYGFANQSGGHVEIDSAVGEGTTIRLYVPRSERAGNETSEAQAATLEARGSGETVLIVEDDPHVRDLVVSLVESLGYIILEAGDASSALDVMKNGSQVDLLLSDIILGKGMNGVELANQVRERCPEVKILLMSGYAREALRHQEGVGDSYELITKPFKMADLARHIEKLLR